MTVAMTRIEFHFNAPERLQYACRLLRKACRQGARVRVTGPAPTLSALDVALSHFTAAISKMAVRRGLQGTLTVACLRQATARM